MNRRIEERRAKVNGARIMVIDDEKIVGKMIKSTFEQDGYTVETFVDAQPALARLEEEKFAVVITDLKMKNIDGMQVLETIKAGSPKTKVIMITAFASMDAAIEALRKKVDDFFPKPIKIKDLKASVKNLLNE
jgi:DNA-binding NtrC family response regulator